MPAVKSKMVTPDEVREWIGAAGVESARGLRFSIHEAFHALDAGLSRRGHEPWHTDKINDAVLSLTVRRRATTEVEARACEWLTLERLGLAEGEVWEGHRLSSWAFTSFREAWDESRIQLPDAIESLIREAKGSRKVDKFARAILACRVPR